MGGLTIITGGQSGVDRAALDVALELGIPYHGWCPRGGWAEDFPRPPGLLMNYPHLRETPSADPVQRTEWNVRDAEAVLMLMPAGGLAVSRGTALARNLVRHYQKPLLMAGLDDPDAVDEAADWIEQFLARAAKTFALGIGGRRESEAPGIYEKSVAFLRAALRGIPK